MRVALVHDDLVQWGGAEKVLMGLCEIFPDAPIYTSVFDGDNNILQYNFGSQKIITSFLQRIPQWKTLYKLLLPLYPLAFEQFEFSEFDLVISHTTRFAKSIITKPQTKHICYCHTPPRFLWHFSLENNYGFGELLMSKLRIYDQISSRRVDYYIAGSENARRRIKKIYQQDSKVVYPFIDLDRFKDVESFDGEYFVVASRLNEYKRVDLAIEACLKLALPLKVVGSGPELYKLQAIANRHQNVEIEFLDKVDDQMLVNILAGCKALIIPGIEDFGLTSLEAQALGKVVIAYKVGGVLETVIDRKTGLFFNDQTVESLMETLKRFNLRHFDRNLGRKNAHKFSKQVFIKNLKQTVASLLYT